MKLGSGTDYLPIIPTSVVFNDYYSCKCFNVSVIDNDYLENSETFSIKITDYKLLHSNTSYFDHNAMIVVRADSTDIIIEDDDGNSIMTSRTFIII